MKGLIQSLNLSYDPPFFFSEVFGLFEYFFSQSCRDASRFFCLCSGMTPSEILLDTCIEYTVYRYANTDHGHLVESQPIEKATNLIVQE